MKERPYSWRMAVAESDLPATTKHVLLTLSLFLADIGEGAFPSLRTLARLTSLTDKALRVHLLRASTKGWLERKERFHQSGRQMSNLYLVRIPQQDVRVGVLTWGEGERGSVSPEGGRGNVEGGTGGERGGRGTTLNSPQEQSTLSFDQEQAPARTRSTAMFERMWEVCRRGSKKAALAQYLKAVPAKVDHEVLFAAWMRIVASASSPEFVPHLFRWIRDERWSEDVPAPGETTVEPGTPEWFAREEARIRGVA